MNPRLFAAALLGAVFVGFFAHRAHSPSMLIAYGVGVVLGSAARKMGL